MNTSHLYVGQGAHPVYIDTLLKKNKYAFDNESVFLMYIYIFLKNNFIYYIPCHEYQGISDDDFRGKRTNCQVHLTKLPVKTYGQESGMSRLFKYYVFKHSANDLMIEHLALCV